MWAAAEGHWYRPQLPVAAAAAVVGAGTFAAAASSAPVGC